MQHFNLLINAFLHSWHGCKEGENGLKKCCQSSICKIRLAASAIAATPFFIPKREAQTIEYKIRLPFIWVQLFITCIGKDQFLTLCWFQELTIKTYLKKYLSCCRMMILKFVAYYFLEIRRKTVWFSVWLSVTKGIFSAKFAKSAFIEKTQLRGPWVGKKNAVFKRNFFPSHP